MDYVVIATLNGNTYHHLHIEDLAQAQMKFRDICDASPRFAVAIRNYETGEIVARREEVASR